jgi:endonuclease/exonuclease/phosphatase (EEP) superfamily protein YafD
MLKPSQVHHSHCQTSCKKHVPDTFGLLCWNVYKKNRENDGFEGFLRKHFTGKVDFMLFQEAHFESGKACLLEGFSFEAAANLEMEDRYYGVLTASRVVSRDARAFLTEEREMLLGTHKSLLLTKYFFADGTELLLVNIHAINFRENSAFGREKERLLTFLADYEGALVIAGDFNTWNSNRVESLILLRERLALEQVAFSQPVKSIFGNPIDLIFYRGLSLLDSKVVDDHGISDHHPLYVKFRKL